MGIASPYPLKSKFEAMSTSYGLCRQASGRRYRAGMYWCVMPSQVQDCTNPPTPVLLSLWVGACVGSHSLRHRHAMPNRAAAGAEVVNVPHRLGTRKQGAAE